MRALRGRRSLRPEPGSATSEISVGTALTAGVSPSQRRAAGRRPKAESTVGPTPSHPPIGDHSTGPPKRVTPPPRARRYGSGVPARIALSSAGSIAPPLTSADSPSALSAQEALARLRSAHEAAAEALEAQEADAQLASLQDALAQLADDHDAAAHEAEFHEALAHEASALAAEAQLAASKRGAPVAGSVVMNLSSARFGFGGPRHPIAPPPLPSPTPSD